jgi:uncharacterized membrane protein
VNKQEFLKSLRRGLKGMPKDFIDGHVNFYAEMIDDKIEEGLTEEVAVSSLGSVESIVAQIKVENPTIATKKSSNNGALKVVLIALGSPIWISVLVALFAVIISLYAVIWSLVASLWAVFASLVAVAIVGVVGLVWAFFGNALLGIALLGAGLLSIGLAIFAFFGVKALTKWCIVFTKKSALFIKNLFCKKEVGNE